MIDPRDEYIKAMRAVPVVVRALVHPLDDRALRRRPDEGEWAAIEVIAHMADTDERALQRIRRMRDEHEPELAGFDQEALASERGYIDFGLEPALERLEAVLAGLADELVGLDDDDWQQVGLHSEHGQMTIADYVSHLVGEDVDHLAQLARLVDS